MSHTTVSEHPSFDSETESRAIRIGGLTTIVRLPSAAGSPVALLEHWLEPGHLGAPVHRHEREDEISHVLEGQVTVWEDGVVTTYGAGETVPKPRHRFHTFWNGGATRARFLEVIAPGTGFDRYFAEISPYVPEGAAPDIAGLMGVAARHGLTMDMEATMELLRQHDLGM